MTDRSHAWSPQLVATLIALLLLVSIVAGGFGEGFVPSKLTVPGDAAGTASNIVHSQWLFRLGFAGYVIEGLCDASLTALLFLLLRPAGVELALIASLLRLVATAAFASAESFYFAALPIVNGAGYLKTFSAGQLDSLAYLSLKNYALAGIVPTLFHGAGWIIFGYLIFVSRYLPRWLGALMAFGGFCFVVGNFLLILAPSYSSMLAVLPMVVAMLAMATWLLARGVDMAKWNKLSQAANTAFAQVN